jgi:hypothetical protein
MKKGIIIGGLVLVIGGVSYFLYMKEKKKEQGLIAENQPVIQTTTGVNQEVRQTPTTREESSRIGSRQEQARLRALNLASSNLNPF